MTHDQLVKFWKDKKTLPSSIDFMFKVINCQESIRRWGAETLKRQMVGKIYNMQRIADSNSERIYLKVPESRVDFVPSFHYTDLVLVGNSSNKSIIPIGPQKLDYDYNEYAKIFGK